MRRILVMPGLGDIHWTLLKLQSWLKRHGPSWDMPELSIWSMDKRPRSLEYFSFLPWAKIGEYLHLEVKPGMDKKVFDSLYLNKGPDVAYNFRGYDALIGLNGNMRHGVPFTQLLGGAEINYNYGPSFPASPEKSYGFLQRELGPYFVLCFSGFGMFGGAWAKFMSPSKIKTLIAALKKEYPGHHFLFTGCSWDDTFSKECMQSWDVSLVGETSLPQFLSLLQHAEAYVGWCGGNSIMAQHFGTPTVEWWSRTYFPTHDRKGWETPHLTPRHLPLEVEDFSQEGTLSTILRFMEVARG